MQFIRPSPNDIFNCHNPKGVKLLTRLRLGLSHLRDHKFKHSFQDSLNPICNCGTDVETTAHYFLYCPLFSDESLILINNILNIDNNMLNVNDSRFPEMLLFTNSSFNNTKNTSILNTTIEYIVPSKKFEVPLFDSSWHSCMTVLFTSYYFYSFLFLSLSFLIFTVLFPIIIDIVLTLFYHVTFEYDFWYSECFWSFLFVKKACPNHLTKLTYILANYHFLFFVQVFFTWIPGTLIFTYLVIVFFLF